MAIESRPAFEVQNEGTDYVYKRSAKSGVATYRRNGARILSCLAFLACLGGAEQVSAKSIISRFCDPWLDSKSATRVECYVEEEAWIVRFDLRSTLSAKEGDRVSPPLDGSSKGADPSEESIAIVFSKEEGSPLYCLEVSGLEEDSPARWSAQIRGDDGEIKGNWRGGGVEVQKEGRDSGEQVVRVRVPLDLLEPVYGRSIDRSARIRVAFLRRTTLQSRPVWSSWRYFAAQDGSPWCPSAFGTLAIDAAIDRDFALPEEPEASRTFRLAANQMRGEFLRYLDDRNLEERTAEWYDRLSQFPEADPEWQVGEWEDKRGITSISCRLPWGDWLGVPFTVHTRFAETGLHPPGWTVEFARENQNREGEPPNVTVSPHGIWRVEWPAEGKQGIIRWRNQGGPVEEMGPDEAIVSFSVPTRNQRGVRDLAIAYRGTESLLDLEVYVDGVRAPISVLQQPAPWVVGTESEALQERNLPWRLSVGGGEVQMVQVYGHSLTAIEAMGLLPQAAMVSWSEWKRENRLQWIGHFAEREDRDGGYLLESLRHYSESAKRAARNTNASVVRD